MLAVAAVQFMVVELPLLVLVVQVVGVKVAINLLQELAVQVQPTQVVGAVVAVKAWLQVQVGLALLSFVTQIPMQQHQLQAHLP
jgi:hypothetical protein